jgi:hypothetical protein
MNATETQLEIASSSCEWWAIGFGALVIVSVIVEVIIACIEPPYAEFLVDSAFTDAGIAIGVIGEVAFGMWDSRIQTELRKRSNDRLKEAEISLASAIERAAKLEKEAADARGRVAEIERLTAWRRISSDDRQQIADELRAIADSLDAHIEYQNGDAEALSYASAIADIFNRAGVKQVTGLPNSFIYEPMFGVFLATPPEVNTSFIVSVFAKGGVVISLRKHDPLWMAPRRPVPNVRMFVGPRPPPPIWVVDDADPNDPSSAAPINSATREPSI